MTGVSGADTFTLGKVVHKYAKFINMVYGWYFHLLYLTSRK